MTTKTAEQLQAELDAANARATKAEGERDTATKRAGDAEKQVADFGENAKRERHAAHVSFCEAQVKAGTLLPKDQAAAVAVLDQLAAGEPVEFSEGDATKKVSPLEFVKGLMQAAKPKVSFGEHAPAGGDSLQAGKGDSDAEIDKKARAYMAQHKVNYSEALTAVTATFST